MEVQARKVSSLAGNQPEPAQPSAAATHTHPPQFRDVQTGIDPDSGKRIISTIQGRTPTYMVTCAACRAADRERMSGPPAALDFARTIFLVPEPAYDNRVARAYIEKRYGNAALVGDESGLNIVHSFQAHKLTFVKGAQVIVVTRRAKNGKMVGPATKRSKDEEGTFYDAPIEPETYIDECVESAPILVSDCITVQPATMFTEQQIDMTELVARLAEVAQPYRIAPPSDPADRMYAMRLNS